MNIFNRILNREFRQSVTLGNPLGRDSGPFLARMNQLATMRNNRGFRTPPLEPRKDAQGLTRGERKRVLRAALFGA